MTLIKSKILKMWDTAAVGVRICCVKFVQRVIQSQTAAGIAGDTRVCCLPPSRLYGSRLGHVALIFGGAGA